MTAEQKIRQFFMASPASGSIGVIKFRGDGDGDPLALPPNSA
jgi:hypothetical protein